MSHASILTPSHIEKLESRLQHLEVVVGRLVGVMEEQGKNKGDAFQQLFMSQEFAQHLKHTLTRYRQDPTQFVDPFQTYRE